MSVDAGNLFLTMAVDKRGKTGKDVRDEKSMTSITRESDSRGQPRHGHIVIK